MRCSWLPRHSSQRGLLECAGIQGAERPLPATPPGQRFPGPPASLCPSVISRASCPGVLPLAQAQAPCVHSQDPASIPQKGGVYPIPPLRKLKLRECVLSPLQPPSTRRDLTGRSSQRQASRGPPRTTVTPPPPCSSERKGPSPRVGSLSSSPAWVTLSHRH